MRCCNFIFKGGLGISEKLLSFFASFLRIHKESGLNTAAAALSYYLTMTVFPLLICLYTMLGNSHESVLRILRFASGLLAPDTIKLIEDFLDYISSSNSSAMLLAGLVLLISYASAAFRSLQYTLSVMQGGHKYKGLSYYAFSVAFSLVFLAVIYFAVLVMLTGTEFAAFINRALPFAFIGAAWKLMKYLVLAVIFYAVLRSIYELPKRPEDDYSTGTGAVFAAGAMLTVSMAFSFVIGRSSNYPLVYGSLASVILLMLWLYCCCVAICAGAAVNIALRDMKR